MSLLVILSTYVMEDGQTAISVPHYHTALSHPRYNNGSTTSDVKQQHANSSRPDPINAPQRMLLPQAHTRQSLRQLGPVEIILGSLRMELST